MWVKRGWDGREVTQEEEKFEIVGFKNWRITDNYGELRILTTKSTSILPVHDTKRSL